MCQREIPESTYMTHKIVSEKKLDISPESWAYVVDFRADSS
jgi:hypothetical protein